MKHKHKTIYNNDGEIIGYSSRPRIMDKYYHRIKMKLKKEHDDCCCCYWCLKERFSTDITCPSCKKRKLKKRGWHINYADKPHDFGIAYYCKCGYDSNPEIPKVL